ncbi:putative transcriptional regulator [Alteracholeplasma palmae J233]|uniref:Putative transcriptional regulator n=1 Tax=Alteracholeplasma palmae (strain ATCC 49389 / J233) TaxID=1318466 RepID=U4KJP9_ALTPJ|nr:helix-turn-helix transcriptional regulator [Alteracholeplasma palmae]CCV63764.1 putative transcriptional regulator [Alteracholeplasma palmae J233]
MNNLKELRAKLKLTQTDVANFLGITQTQYSLHETGKSILNANQILKLCELYKCSPNELLGWRGIYETSTKEWDE